MPKMHKDFPAQLSSGTTLEMKQKLVAIGYMMGSGGEYSAALRNLLGDGIRRFIDGLDERRRAEYDSILANVKAREVLAITDERRQSEHDATMAKINAREVLG